MESINEFRRKLTKKDHFLIYYAGNGEFDRRWTRPYWLPVDRERTETTDEFLGLYIKFQRTQNFALPNWE